MFDPKEKFRVGNFRVSPVTRKRVRTVRSVIDGRKQTRHYSFRSEGNSPVHCAYVNKPATARDDDVTTDSLPSSPPISYISEDTTRRSRPPYSDQGEFKSFKYDLIIPDRSWNAKKTYTQRGYFPPCSLPEYLDQVETCWGGTTGGAALFTESSVNILREDTFRRTEEAFASKVPKMVANLLPSARRYSLARNLVELKDLPRSIASLQSTLADLSRASKSLPEGFWQTVRNAKVPDHLPNEWLSFWFGWRQVYKDVVDLMNAPAKVSKDVNFLLARKGVPTTIRSRSKFPGDGSNGPAFTLSPEFTNLRWTYDEPQGPVVTKNEWEHEIRVVMNLIFDFPNVGVPKLREELFSRKLGLTPTFTDLYNLVPWTWLVDWFVGLGDYVELIDNINTDRSLVNWALATCVTTGKLTTSAKYEYENVRQRLYYTYPLPSYSDTVRDKVSRLYTFQCNYTCHIRKNVSDGFGVKSTLELDKLSPYQASILGALLAQRSGISRN